ncbi:MAG: hypothetical protein QF662_06170, partial [Phycisphaerae bacterium]|nr:hypothetical protein [Phycisphaerae bacterium]
MAKESNLLHGANEPQEEACEAQAIAVVAIPEGEAHPVVRMGDRLIEQGHITLAQLIECLKLQKSSPGERLGQILVRKGYVSEEQVMACLADEYGLEFVHVSVDALPPPKVQEILPGDFCKRHQVLVIDATDEEVTVATADPANVFLLDEMRRIAKVRVKLAVASAAEIKRVVEDISAPWISFDVDKLLRDVNDESVQVLDDGLTEEIPDL